MRGFRPAVFEFQSDTDWGLPAKSARSVPGPLNDDGAGCELVMGCIESERMLPSHEPAPATIGSIPLWKSLQELLEAYSTSLQSVLEYRVIRANSSRCGNPCSPKPNCLRPGFSTRPTLIT